MTKTFELCTVIAGALCTAGTAMAADRPPWPATLPVYDHIVIVVEENKDFEQILGGRFDAPYLRKWPGKAPPSSACSPKNILVKAIISGCSPAATTPWCRSG